MNDKKNILFLCSHNSCRSQMAEGFAKRYFKDEFNIYSAGTKPTSLDALAVEAMKEVEIDICMHRSKNINELGNVKFDFVITVCDRARELCPIFSYKTNKMHKSFEDPSALAESAETKEEKLAFYRKVRDEIKGFILKLPQILEK
jgi:arsenate reductase